MREEVLVLIASIEELEYLIMNNYKDIKDCAEYNRLIQEKNNFIKRYGGILNGAL